MIHYMTTQGVGDAWVGNELRIVDKANIPFVLHALNKPQRTYFTASDVAGFEQDTHYIYPVSRRAVAGAVLAAPARFGWRAVRAFGNALFGRREDFRTRLMGIWHFAVACHWAAHMRNQKVDHIHSQWIHSAGTVAMFGAWLLDRPFSFTGHAADLFRNRAALLDKIDRADFIICISEFHRQFYLDHGADPAKLHLVYCGIDTSHFTPRRRVRSKGAPLQIRSAGRLVDKKGFADLIEACGLLAKHGVAFHCTIGGSGPLEADLRAKIADAGLSDHIEMMGTALKQEDIPDFMYGGDLFCLPCVWADDNDVDGLPQLSMEAMACGLPVITTDLVGNPDLVQHDKTGLLVPPGDPAALADAIQRLGADDTLAQELAENGHAHVRDVFDISTCLTPLLNKYKTALETSR
jgi:colanic acid/amylovoran biosynthesis glycosyltransferase